MKKALIILMACLFLASCASKGPSKKQGPGDLYVDGVNLMKQKKYDKAIHKFAEVTENYPFDPLALVAAVKLGDAHFEKKDYVMAASVYESFVSAHPEDDNAPYVLLRTGECYERLSSSIDRDQANTLKAIDKYSLLKNRYPRSNYSKTVDDRLKIMEQKLADREVYIGEFYYKTYQYNACIVRLEYFIKKYPQAGGVDKALFYIALSYKELAMPQKSDIYSERLKKEYPNSIYARSTVRERKSLKMASGIDDIEQSQGITRKRLNPEAQVAQAVQAPDQKPVPAAQAAATPAQKPAPTAQAAAAAPSPGPSPAQPASDAPHLTNDIEAALLPQTGAEKEESRIFEEDMVGQPSTSSTTPPTTPRSKRAKGRQPAAQPRQTAKQDQGAVKQDQAAKPGPSNATQDQATVYTSDTANKRAIDLTPGMYAAQKPESPAAAAKGAADQAKPAAGEKKGEDKPQAAGKDKKKDLDFFDKSKPIDIVSDSMEGFDKEKYVVFKGNVIAKQEDLFIFADTIEAYLNEESNEIDKAYAKGNVKIVKKERTATAKEALFDNRKGEIVLKGNVIVFQGQDKLTGDVVTYYVNEDKAVVEGEKTKRARAILTPTK